MADKEIVFRINRTTVKQLLLIASVILTLTWVFPLRAQKVQDKYSDKFKIAGDTGGAAVATSSDGQHVYVVGVKGILVSNDYGKTGSWTQTVRMK